MENSESIWDKAKKIGKPAIIAMLGALITGIATQFDIPLGSQKAQESEQPADSSSPSATGIEGGIHIYPPQTPASQPEAQPVPENSLDTEETIPSGQKELVSQNNTQEMRDGNTNSPQINGDDVELNISSERNDIEEQTNIERNTQTGEGSQYFENAGFDNTFCAGNDDTACSNDGTINNNPAQ